MFDSQQVGELSECSGSGPVLNNVERGEETAAKNWQSESLLKM